MYPHGDGPRSQRPIPVTQPRIAAVDSLDRLHNGHSERRYRGGVGKLSRCAAGLGTVVAVVVLCVPAAAAAAPIPTVSLRVPRAQVLGGRPVRLAGEVTGVPVGSLVRLYESPFPYPVAKLVKTTLTNADGAFYFTVFPDRGTRYRVTVVGTRAAALVQVAVGGRSSMTVRALPLGQARVTIVVFHPRDLPWGDARVNWSFAAGNHGAFHSAPATLTRELSPYAALLATTVTLPAGRFRFRGCLQAPDGQALLDPVHLPGCTGRAYQGGGSLPVGFPGPAAIARAEGYLSRRAGRTALAVVDSEGRVSGVNLHRTFVTGSVVKAMLLVAYLRRLSALGRRDVDAYSRSFLYPMIHVSDNAAATQTWSIVGDSGLYAVARAAGMTDFSISGIWANAQISAADQSKFFFEMDLLIPRQFVGYARFLLSTIAGYESWGIPAVARPLGYEVFFKAGWRPTGLGQLVHQIARLEGHGHTFSLAVMTDGDPSMGYGIDTIQGLTRALL
jgi:hypothetical protein